jgi:hypothetical protein
MKAITLKQPYASFIAHGIKTVETRSWQTHHRGLLAIHAGATWEPGWLRWHHPDASMVDDLVDGGIEVVEDLNGSGFWRPDRSRSPRSQIVAVVRLWDCVPTDTLADCSRIGADLASNWWGEEYEPKWDYGHREWELDAERRLGDFAPGRYAWLLECVLTCREHVKGRLGLWDWPPPDTVTVALLERAMMSD